MQVALLWIVVLTVLIALFLLTLRRLSVLVGRTRSLERYQKQTRQLAERLAATADPFVTQLELHGQELTFAPLEEVADIAVEGILADRFWIYPPSERSRATVDARAASMRDGLEPEYLIAPSPWNVPKESSDSSE